MEGSKIYCLNFDYGVDYDLNPDLGELWVLEHSNGEMFQYLNTHTEYALIFKLYLHGVCIEECFNIWIIL